MKKLFTLILLITVNYSAPAQQVIFKENFDSMPGLALSQGWTSYQSGVAGWRTSDMYNLYCSYSLVPQYAYWAKVAAISGCYDPDKGGPRNNSNVFAYTKSINLSAVQDGAFLKYDSYFNRLNAYLKYEKATVEVSINDGASWTVVQDVPAGSTKDSFTTWYINLSQYIGYGNLRIGFRYSDQGVNQQYGGWAIDNIELFRPEHIDMELVQFSPVDTLAAYVTVNNTLIHHGTVLNKGLDTIHSFTIKYRRGNDYILEDAYNATIPPLTKFDFVHKVPDTVFNHGRTAVTAWVETPGDSNHKNDTAHNYVYGAYFTPKKRVAVEEGTATWNMFGPRGLVYMDALHYDNDACLVSIHSSDPMDMKQYSDYLYGLNYYSGQYFLLDRQYVDPNELFSAFSRYNRHFGFADLEMNGGVTGNRIDIGVRVKPAVDITGDFRLLLVITEDEVKGSLGGYRQTNGYAGGAMGAMGGYQNKPDPVPAADMKYNYVARVITPSPGGDKPFATELKYNGDYYHKFNISMDEGWDKNKLRAIVMLFKNDDTLILNSNQLTYFLDIAGGEKEQIFTGIYPNPANLYTTLQFEAKGNEQANILITDISGRTVMQIPVKDTKTGKNELKIPTASLPDGLYIVNVITEQVRHALKLQVMH